MANQPKYGLSQALGFDADKLLTELNAIDVAGFDPNDLLDALIAKMHLENDVALAGKLQVIQPVIRMIREGSLTMRPSVLLAWIEDCTGIRTIELRRLMVNRRTDA
jgi:hypothetical protein